MRTQRVFGCRILGHADICTRCALQRHGRGANGDAVLFLGLDQITLRNGQKAASRGKLCLSQRHVGAGHFTHAETVLRQGKGKGLHPFLTYALISATALILATLIAGPTGLALWLLIAAHAQLQIHLSDYVQHYGLTRATGRDGKPEPVGPGHSWNTAHWFSSALLLNAPRHSDHHSHPNRPYPALRLPDGAPRLPWPLPLAAAIALIPPLWRHLMRPHLARLTTPDRPAADTQG